MDDLEKLLAKADTPAPPVRSDLAGIVRHVVSRRRRHRRIVVASLGLLLASGISLALLMPHRRATSGPVTVQTVDVEAIRREIAELKLQVRFHEQIAQAIENSRSSDDKNEDSRLKFSEPDVLMQLDQRRQVAAQLMLAHAEQLASDPQKHEEATANYKKVVALFPDTLASRAASDRLRAAGI